ncbi:3'-5' exoribonuclease [Staphylococcus pasteuri]|uniref:exonuclease domain-containing protein n=2 Tax=Staphylococcus pasteuri TaxID=45972 RepID=UPI002277829E|nr:exonuclease domain-containing protein [Staphylococcus pasteuri]WAE40429.1 3'-5' exoribonuclease [Staphylococcus pasteuri]
MKKYDLAIIDFEIMNNETNSPCEIAINLVKGLKIIDTYSTYINPKNNYYDNEIALIHKIPKKVIEAAPKFEDVYDQIKHYIENSSYVIAHNAHFDVSVLLSTIEHNKFPMIKFIYIDSIAIFRKYLNLKSFSMSSLCKTFNISTDNLHSAQYDVKALTAILLIVSETNNYKSMLELIQNMDHSYIKYSEFTNIQYAFPSFRKYKRPTLSVINQYKILHPNNIHLLDKNIVFTGEFKSGKSNLMIKARENGAIIRSDVSKKTDILIEGIQEERFKGTDGLVSKQRKARKLICEGYNIKLLSENELLNLLESEKIYD